MLWRELSRLARAAAVVTALAVSLAVLMVIALAVSTSEIGLAAFYYWMSAAFTAVLLWGIAGVRRVCTAARRAR